MDHTVHLLQEAGEELVVEELVVLTVPHLLVEELSEVEV